MVGAAIAALGVMLLQAVAVSAQRERCSEPDLATLAQREVHVSRPFADFWLLSRGGDVEAEVDTHARSEKVLSMLHTIVGQLQSGLQEHEHNLQVESAQALLMKNYVAKVKQGLFKKGTLFSDTGGLVPLGQMDEADRAAVGTLLNLFRSEAFATALADGVSGFADAMMHYRWRAEKRVAGLVAASADSTDTKLSGLLVGFFQNQHHLISDFLAQTQKSMKNVIAELPANYSIVAKFASVWTDQLMGKATEFLDANIERMTKTHGDSFCQGSQPFLMEELLPMVNGTASSLHAVVELAKARTPDVAERITAVAEALSAVPLEVQRLEALAPAWTEKVCGLVGARAPR